MQLDRLPVPRMRIEHAQRRAGGAARALAPRRLGLELESDLAVRLLDEIGGERSARARRDELQQIGLARLQQLRHLRAVDDALQDRSARAEVATPALADGTLAHV